MHLTFKPIGPWPIVAIAALAVMLLTIWAYRQKLRGTSGRWRWVALGLRLTAVLLCLLAALRPSLLIDEKKKQDSVVLFLIDGSGSMKFTDEVGGQSRWRVARKALGEAVKQVDGKSKQLAAKTYRFDNDLHDYKADDPKEPDGRESALGTVLLKAVKESQGTRISSIVLISDGASNGGTSPLAAAQQLKAQQIPVLTVGVGSADAGKGSSELAARDLVAGPTVFVKNRPEIRGVLGVRGFGGKSVEVELLVEGDPKPVDTQSIKVPEGAEVVPVTGLKYVPETPGEKRLTLRVKQQPGELVASNNEVSTYLDVLKGGLKVLYIQGPDFSWEPRFLIRAVDPAREINTELRVIREPARGDKGLLDDADFTPGQYDVYILGGVPADHFTRPQIALLARAVERGAGLMMLGGRSSFGLGGWGTTELDRVLPSHLSTADNEEIPGDEGVKVVPSTNNLNEYILRLGSNPTESKKVWDSLAPITGYNRLGKLNPLAVVLAQAGRDPVMLALDDAGGRGRSLAFGGETWPWARTEKDAHARFWRQVILWLARRENKGEDQVKLKLDARRVAVGQKLDLTASARDGKNEPIPEAQFEATFTPVDAKQKATGKSEPIPLFPQGEESKGPIFANVAPGEYEVVVKGKRGGKEFAQTKARFMVYQDDRELENPAADPALLRQIAETTGGTSLPSEELASHLKTLGPEAGEYVQQIDKRLWDNWPFFLIFTAVLTAEWALRKSKGWV